MVKHIAKRCPEVLLRAINKEYSERNFSANLKKTKATVLPKSEELLLTTDQFRIVLSSPILAKIYEKIILKGLLFHMEKRRKRFSGPQYAYIKDVSTMDMLRDIKEFLNLNDSLIFSSDVEKVFESSESANFCDLATSIPFLMMYSSPFKATRVTSSPL